MAGKYDDLTKEQLISLLEKNDRTRKLGLVWERDQIEADKAIDANFVACSIQPALSDKAAPWRNLVIEGDNYDVLRWLRMTYSGRVKCIYIDPPYNTGNKDWVYNDHFINKDDRYRHSTWLEFIYRRLTLARDLLTEDGVILVSINDENRAKLEMLMDEALPGMRLGCGVWRTRKGGYDSGNFSEDHEYVLIYSNSKFEFAGSAKQRVDYSNPDDDPRGDWTDDPIQQPKNFRQRKNGVYLILNPKTGVYYPPNPNRVWSIGQRGIARLSGPAIEDLIEDNLIIFNKPDQFVVYKSREELDLSIGAGQAHKFANPAMPNLDDWIGKKIGLGSVRIKKFKKTKDDDVNPLSSLMDGEESDDSFAIDVGMNQEGTREINKIFGDQAFNYPKPPSLIRELVRQSTLRNDLVLDFFAGSATTAQAVMELNAEDDGDRRFIMVSSTESTPDEPNKNICRDVTAERIRRLNASEDKKFVNLASEFAYLTKREIAFEDMNYELKGNEAWTALEAIHDLPLTLYEEEKPFQIHEADGQVLVYVDRFDESLIKRLRALGEARRNVFVYAWAPGQIKPHLAGLDIEVKPVRETLVRRFQQ